MTFTNKNLQSHKSGMTFLKGATFFFLGMSLVMFMTKAFEVVPSTRNTSMFLKSISLTTDGGSSSYQGITLDGSGGNAYFGGTVTGATFCLEGDDCITTRPELTSAGSARAIQYNGSGGLFSGSSYFTRDSSIQKLYVDGTGDFNYITTDSVATTDITIEGSTDILGSVIVNNCANGYDTGLFLPGLTGSTENNDARDTDSIWYISCVSGSNTGQNLLLVGYTGEHMYSGYFFLPIKGNTIFTYHLPKGETAYIMKNSLCNIYIAYSQKYGGTGTVSSWNHPNWLTGEEMLMPQLM